uniref:Uncharacterized protein n=1 Tax=Knipowitschia caucasica TaxID=637954 RepID=A0AAV2M9V6_KNICA
MGSGGVCDWVNLGKGLEEGVKEERRRVIIGRIDVMFGWGGGGGVYGGCLGGWGWEGIVVVGGGEDVDCWFGWGGGMKVLWGVGGVGVVVVVVVVIVMGGGFEYGWG